MIALAGVKFLDKFHSLTAKLPFSLQLVKISLLPVLYYIRVLMFRISLVDTFYFAIHTYFEVLNALDTAISLLEIHRFY